MLGTERKQGVPLTRFNSRSPPNIQPLVFWVTPVSPAQHGSSTVITEGKVSSEAWVNPSSSLPTSGPGGVSTFLGLCC